MHAEVELGVVICLTVSVYIDWLRCGDVVGDLYQAITLLRKSTFSRIHSRYPAITLQQGYNTLVLIKTSYQCSLKSEDCGERRCLLLSYNTFCQRGMRK